MAEGLENVIATILENEEIPYTAIETGKGGAVHVEFEDKGKDADLSGITLGIKTLSGQNNLNLTVSETPHGKAPSIVVTQSGNPETAKKNNVKFILSRRS